MDNNILSVFKANVQAHNVYIISPEFQNRRDIGERIT